MILKSTSNHHPLNMRLLLIALTCLGAALAAPQLKQKRDILPGDPRYGTDYHHHHHHHHPETVVETTRSVGGYAYSIPDTPLQLPQEIYGPPHYQPELPVNNEYLPPTIVTPGPSYGEPIGVNAPLEIDSEQPTIVDVKTVSSTPLPLPLEKVQPVTQPALTSSYGTPVDDHVKTAVRTSGAPLKTVKTEIHGHSTVDLPKSVLKVKEQLPLVQGATHVTTEVKSVPSVTTTFTKNYVSGSLINKSVPTLHSTVGLFPTFNAVSHTPSVFDHPTTLTGAHADFSGYGTGLTSSHGLKHDATLTAVHGVNSAHLGTPLTSVHVTKNVPNFYPSQYTTYGFPDTKVQLPESFTHFEQHVAPTVNTFEAVTPTPFLHTGVHSYQTPLKPVETLTHVHQPLQHTLTHVEPVHTVKTLDTLTHQPLQHTLTHVEPVHTVKTLDTLTHVHQPLQHTLTHVEPVHTVKTLDTLTRVHQPLQHTLTHVEPVHTVKTLDTLTHQPLRQTFTHVEPVHTEGTVETTVHHAPSLHSYQPVHTAHLTLPTVQPVTSVKSVETQPPVHHVESVNTFHHLQPVTSVKSVKTVTPVHHVESVNTVHHLQPVTSVKSVKTVTPVHQVESVHTHPIESVETLHHPIDSVDVLPAVQRTHTYTNTAPVFQKNVNVHVQKDVFSDFFNNIASNLPTLPSLPQLPQLPSLPSFQFPTVQTSTASPLEVSTVVNTYVSEDHARDSVTVDNPLFGHDNLPSHVTQHVTPSKEYVQPTDENGGYIY